MDFRISISIIAILAILYGIINTTTTNSAWSQTGLNIEIDSQKCVNNNVDSEIAFSWKGYSTTDTLDVLILDPAGNNIMASQTIKVQGDSYSGVILFNGPKLNKPYELQIFDPVKKLEEDRKGFDSQCGVSEEHKK